MKEINMIYNTAYETTVCKNMVTKNIKQEIMKMRIMGVTDPNEPGTFYKEEYPGIYCIYRSSDITPFSHPFYIENGNDKYLTIDLRTYVHFDSDNNLNFKVINNGGYDLITTRALLNKAWINYPKKYFLFDDRIIKVYSDWISTLMAKRYGLNLSEIINVSIITGAFYMSLFKDQGEWDEYDIYDIVNKLVNALRLPLKTVDPVVRKIDKQMLNVSDLCSQIVFQLENIRLKDFTQGALYSVVANSTFSTQNRGELLGIALEHPPTWVSILYNSLNSSIYRKTIIADIAGKSFKSNNIKNFIMNVEDMKNNMSTEDR